MSHETTGDSGRVAVEPSSATQGLSTVRSAILDHLHEGCQLINADFRYVYLNSAAAAQTRRRPEELIGKTMTEVFPGIETTDMFRALSRCLAERTPHRMDNELVYPDGSAGWFALRMEPVPEGVFILSLDVTERRQLEARCLQAQKMESVGRLAAGVVHDFNNLLTVISGTAELAGLTLSPDDPAQQALTEIRAAGAKAAALTRGLLAISRRRALQTRAVDLSQVAAELQPLLRRMLDANLRLRVELADDLDQVMADPSQVEQVILNLVVNARDATPDGGSITIRTRNVPAGEAPPGIPGACVLLAIEDTGTGMDATTQTRIFEPFYTTKAEGQGTGLGLATTHDIVEQAGGVIEVDTDPGHGSTFRIFLPSAARPGPAAARGARRASAAAPSSLRCRP